MKSVKHEYIDSAGGEVINAAKPDTYGGIIEVVDAYASNRLYTLVDRRIWGDQGLTTAMDIHNELKLDIQ